MEDKKSLASEEKLAKVKGKASLLAAIDYYVSMHSDIFISASPGNMHNALVRIIVQYIWNLIIMKSYIDNMLCFGARNEVISQNLPFEPNIFFASSGGAPCL